MFVAYSKMRTEWIAYVLAGVVMIIGIRLIVESEFYQLRCINSELDGQRYCVRERHKLQMAADRLANIRSRLDKLVKHCSETRPDAPEVQRMTKNYNPKKICETLPSSEHTAYSENKGEKMAFCLDTERDGKGRLIDLNTLTFVALHELAHVATVSIGHTPEYWQNFRMLLKEAAGIGIYDPEDYSKEPARYCGMEITDNPYFT